MQQTVDPQPYVPAAPVRPPRFGNLAWAALILGIVGLVGSPVIIFNNITAIAAGVGAILGVIALFGTKKVAAAIGVGLCVAAIAVTVTVQKAAVEEFEDAIGGGTSDDASATLQIGNTHKGEGMNVTVGKPKGFTTSDMAMPEQNAKAFRVPVAVKNTADEALKVNLLNFDASIDGRPAEQVFDSASGVDGMLEMPDLAPGRSAKFTVAFLDVANGELVVQVDTIGGDNAVQFVGKR